MLSRVLPSSWQLLYSCFPISVFSLLLLTSNVQSYSGGHGAHFNLTLLALACKHLLLQLLHHFNLLLIVKLLVLLIQLIFNVQAFVCWEGISFSLSLLLVLWELPQRTESFSSKLACYCWSEKSLGFATVVFLQYRLVWRGRERARFDMHEWVNYIECTCTTYTFHSEKG